MRALGYYDGYLGFLSAPGPRPIPGAKVTDIGDALKQMRDLLVPGGRLRLVESKPHWCNAIIWLQWRHRTFAREDIHALVKDVGFEIESDDAFPAGPPSRTSRGIVARRI
jgi:hypothetical protein